MVIEMANSVSGFRRPSGRRYFFAGASRNRERTLTLAVAMHALHALQKERVLLILRYLAGASRMPALAITLLILAISDFMAAASCAGVEPPVVFGGDFNSLPGSEVHALLTAPPLRSVYTVATGSEPSFTNLTPPFTGTLDYLLVTPDVTVHAALETPGPGLGSGLPDAKHPSDHLPLAAVLGLA